MNGSSVEKSLDYIIIRCTFDDHSHKHVRLPPALTLKLTACISQLAANYIIFCIVWLVAVTLLQVKSFTMLNTRMAFLK